MGVAKLNSDLEKTTRQTFDLQPNLMFFMPGEPHSNGSRFPIGAGCGGATSAAVQPVRRKAKKTCSPRKAFSAVLSLSLIVKVLGSFKWKASVLQRQCCCGPVGIGLCCSRFPYVFSFVFSVFFGGGGWGGFQWQLAAVASSLLSQVKGR